MLNVRPASLHLAHFLAHRPGMREYVKSRDRDVTFRNPTVSYLVPAFFSLSISATVFWKLMSVWLTINWLPLRPSSARMRMMRAAMFTAGSLFWTTPSGNDVFRSSLSLFFSSSSSQLLSAAGFNSRSMYKQAALSETAGSGWVTLMPSAAHNALIESAMSEDSQSTLLSGFSPFLSLSSFSR
ncbi:hypothetical protein PFISCL1PPCAC_4691, partial [Pristionchus fissidentatus]